MCFAHPRRAPVSFATPCFVASRFPSRGRARRGKTVKIRSDSLAAAFGGHELVVRLSEVVPRCFVPFRKLRPVVFSGGLWARTALTLNRYLTLNVRFLSNGSHRGDPWWTARRDMLGRGKAYVCAPNGCFPNENHRRGASELARPRPGQGQARARARPGQCQARFLQVQTPRNPVPGGPA